jgi:hypothetical protein
MARSASPACIATLYSRIVLYKADLFTITLLNGSVYDWTDFDQPVSYGGTTWLNQGPLLQRNRLGVKQTVEVPELEIQLSALDTDFIGGIGIKTALHNGVFDGATVLLQRLPMPVPGDISLGPPIVMFGGRMSSAQIDALGAVLLVKGANVLMNQYVPRNQFQASDNHNFCDAGCTLLASTLTLTASACAGGTTNRIIQWSGPPANQALYGLGKITMTSGPASGQIRSVAGVGAGAIVLSYPLYDTPAPGDTFSIMRGCDKTFNSGSGQSCTDYSNTQHYRGFPFIPPAETAI